MASGFSLNNQPRIRNVNSIASPGLTNAITALNRPGTDRSGVPLSRVRRRIISGNSENLSSQALSTQTCRFFRQGLCQYGDRCRFFHIETPLANPIRSSDSASINAGSSNGQQAVDIRSSQRNLLAHNWRQRLHLHNTDQQKSQKSKQDPLKPNSQTPKPQTSTVTSSAQVKPDNGVNNDSTGQGLQVKQPLMNPIYDKWLKAPEFVPSANRAKMKSYAEAVNPAATSEEQAKYEMKLCPYAEMHGVCSYPDGECTYLHGNICDLCGTASLHPYNQEKSKLHIQSCIEQHERNMELSFAVQRSKEKSCGVCFEVIMEKSAREQRFGILPNCNHCFCLTCIRKWRQAKQFDNKIIRACPECRVTSDFVCPSMFWVDTKEEKEKLIEDYKCALSQKNCKYFRQGRGKCPFGNKCFYLHALPDGTKTDVGPPPRQPRRQAHDGDIDVLQQIILWDFLDDRENRWLYSIADDLEDLVAFFSDSEDSDWSEYEFFFD